MPDKDCLHQRITKIENDIENHHDTLENHSRRLSDLAGSLHENTALTRQIADNTGEMVELFKDAKVVVKWGSIFRKFLLWLSSVAAVFYGAYHWFMSGK